MSNDELTQSIGLINKEMWEQVDTVKREYGKRRQSVLNQWADEHKRFDVGNILRSYDTIVRVEKYYGCISGSDKPYVVYLGPMLTKQLKPRKDGTKMHIYDDGRVIEKIK